jgi:hypothetical protein
MVAVISATSPEHKQQDNQQYEHFRVTSGYAWHFDGHSPANVSVAQMVSRAPAIYLQGWNRQEVERVQALGHVELRTAAALLGGAASPAQLFPTRSNRRRERGNYPFAGV